MSQSAAQILVVAGAVYAAIGLLFGLWFVARGVDRVDPAARRSSRGFRGIVLPGVIVLWPLLMLRVARGVERPPEEKTAHRAATGDRA